MASLWSRLLGDRTHVKYDGDALSGEDITRRMRIWRQEQPKLVNLTAFENSWNDDPEAEFSMQKMDATPAFPLMWFEWIHKGTGRNAVMVTRRPAEAIPLDPSERPENAKFMLEMTFLHEADGCPLFRGSVMFHIDQLGCLAGQIKLKGERSKDSQGHFMSRVALICDALTTINTHGTRIEPPFNSAQAHIVKPDRAPCSVWHTIHLPRFARPPLEDANISPEILERREHWVRAHRRDYRHGSGMFGRVKALVWVAEFQRGNVELGTVKQSYCVGAAK